MSGPNLSIISAALCGLVHHQSSSVLPDILASCASCSISLPGLAHVPCLHCHATLWPCIKPKSLAHCCSCIGSALSASSKDRVHAMLELQHSVSQLIDKRWIPMLYTANIRLCNHASGILNPVQRLCYLHCGRFDCLYCCEALTFVLLQALHPHCFRTNRQIAWLNFYAIWLPMAGQPYGVLWT